MKFKDLLMLFGVDLDKTAQYQAALPLQKTHLVQFELPDPKKAITFPIRFDRSFCLEKSALVSRMVEIWGEVPISIIQMFDVRRCQFGYIGTDGYMMYPLIRPGSFVQIQRDLNRVQPGAWRTEFDRPIYFIELRDAYACSWCELKGSQLILIQHPLGAGGPAKNREGMTYAVCSPRFARETKQRGFSPSSTAHGPFSAGLEEWSGLLRRRN